MPSEELVYARRQVDDWNTHVGIHQESIDNVETILKISDILTEVAIVAIVSAATMGLANAMSSTAIVRALGARIAAGAEGLTPGILSSNAALRVIAGVGAGTTQRLADAELRVAFTSLASRVFAAPLVTGTVMCVRRKMSGGNIDRRFIREELSGGILMAIVCAWLAAPGPKTEFQSSLMRRIADQAPSWRRALTSAVPANQALIQGTLIKDLAERIFTGDFEIDRVREAMAADGVDFDEVRGEAIAETRRQTKQWAQQTAPTVTAAARTQAGTHNYGSMVGAVARAGHRARELLTNDAPIEQRLRLEYTELLVAIAGRDFWDGVAVFLECLDETE